MVEFKVDEKKKGDEGLISDEEIKGLEPDAIEAKEEYFEKKKEDIKATVATRKKLLSRKKRIYDLYVYVDDDEALLFRMRRMTEAEKAKLDDINFKKMSANWGDLDAEDMKKIEELSYKTMAEVIVEPKMTAEEWKETADIPLLNFLSNRVAFINNEINDNKVIELFKKKSTKLQSFSSIT